MKHLLTFSFCLWMTGNLALANDGKYIEVMRKNIESIYSAESITDLQNAVNSMDRIAKAEKSQWEPFYYVSFGYILIANKESDAGKKDSYLDLARTALDKSMELKKDDSENLALEGFIYMIRVTVDPAARGPQFVGLAMQSYQKALSFNPSNPRALALLAQMQFGTAQFFNQVPTEACATANKALSLFTDQHSDNLLAPRWGKPMTEGLVKNCK